MSMNFDASIVFDKGLSNYLGHNNCFLNSAVQVFWHLDVFRKNFLSLKHHYCIQGSCIYCSLLDIFKEFKESGENVLHPDMLRVTLSVAFQDQLKFQLGEIDDASECYENILSRIHFHLSEGAPDDFCVCNHCITHTKFAMSLIQQSQCSCGATSEPLSYTQLVHYISTSSIINASNEAKSAGFGEVLRSAVNFGSLNTECQLKCGLKCKVVHTLVNLPDVVSIGLVWDSERSEQSHIKEFVSAIGTSLALEDLFDVVVEKKASGKSQRNLVGVVCYYLKHYSTFFFHSKKKIWISFDDASVTEIGEDWSKVVDKCCKGKYQPLLLIYQNRDAEAVDTTTAPTETTQMHKGFGKRRSARSRCEDSSRQTRDSLMPSNATRGFSTDRDSCNEYFYRSRPGTGSRLFGHGGSPDEESFYGVGRPTSSLRSVDPWDDVLRGGTSDERSGGDLPAERIPGRIISPDRSKSSQRDHLTPPTDDVTRRGNNIPRWKSEQVMSGWTIIEASDSDANSAGSSTSVYENVDAGRSSRAGSARVSDERGPASDDLMQMTPSNSKTMRELDSLVKMQLFKDKVKALYRT